MDTITITEEDIRKLAQKHPDILKDLKALCPDAFSGPFNFGKEHKIDRSFEDKPLVIAEGFAPPGMRLKCLILNDDFRMKKEKYDGRTILTFYRR